MSPEGTREVLEPSVVWYGWFERAKTGAEVAEVGAYGRAAVPEASAAHRTIIESVSEESE